MGKSGSGKTYSLKNFKPDEIGIISVEKQRLPFKSDLKVARIPRIFDTPEEKTSYSALNRAKYAWIESVIAKRSTSNSKYCYAVISYKKTKATKSLNLQYPACKVAPGTQFNIATLEFVTVLGDDGNEYLHLDGKPLTPTE